MTVIWHVNNLMASCEDDFELTKFSCYLTKICGAKLTMHVGEKHDYLGMDMEFRKDGTQGVSMISYLKNVIAEFPEAITGHGEIVHTSGRPPVQGEGPGEYKAT